MGRRFGLKGLPGRRLSRSGALRMAAVALPATLAAASLLVAAVRVAASMLIGGIW